MSDLIQRIDAAIQSRHLLARGHFVLIGVSGGLDSMVLLHVIHQLADSRGWLPAVAHFNHRLRGEAGDLDEQLVRRATEGLGMKFISDNGDVAQFAAEQKLSIEMAARELRHRFFARAAAELGIRSLALAHHANDQLELFFLRLLRGSGPEGLAGMKWSAPSAYSHRLAIIRPLLDVPKSDLERFARERGIEFRTDETNDAVGILRNRVRRQLVPLLERRFQPGLLRTTLRLMEILREDSEWLSQLAREWEITRGSKPFGQLSVALQRQVLCLGLRRFGFSLDFEKLEQLRRFPNKEIMVRPGLTVRRDEKGRVSTRTKDEVQPSTGEIEVTFDGGRGAVAFDGAAITWRIEPWNGVVPKRGSRRTRQEIFDADRVGSRVILRHWRAGDRFQPIGSASPVKLQDLFTNEKVPRAERCDRIVATTVDGEIFWVEGLRISERFKLDNGTFASLKWRCQR